MTSLHALIIDDDDFNVHILEKMLEHFSISSTSVTNPTEVEPILGTLEQVNLIFLDLEMPELDGYEVLALIKDHLPTHIPIVACTVHSGEISMARSQGFSAFIVKPLDLERFPDQLERILNGEPVWEGR